jgi:TPR repeat protein
LDPDVIQLPDARGRRLGLAIAAVVLASVPIAISGCHRGSSGDGAGSPAPSSSVISLAIEIGTCSDIETCARECDAGSADRCRRLAMSYSFGKGVDQDEAHAAELLETACAMSDPSACLFSGQMYEYARGVAKDETKAVKYYERSCEMKWVGGCYNLAVMYEQGRGVPGDVAKARDLYQQACTAGATISCGKVKEMQESPQPPVARFLDAGLAF